MNIKTMRAEMESLFQEWEAAHKRKGYKRFIRDGIVSPEVWYGQPTPKICYLLKEAYSKDKGYDLAKKLKNDNPWQMWKKVAVWTEAIFQAFGDGKEYDQKRIQANIRQNINRIAVINVKKSNGQSNSDYQELKKYAKEDRAFLRRELDIINPDIIVCGYTSHCLRVILGDDWKNNKTDMTLFGEWNGKMVIDYYHPASKYPHRVNYYALMSICRLAIEKYKILGDYRK